MVAASMQAFSDNSSRWAHASRLMTRAGLRAQRQCSPAGFPHPPPPHHHHHHHRVWLATACHSPHSPDDSLCEASHAVHWSTAVQASHVLGQLVHTPLAS